MSKKKARSRKIAKTRSLKQLETPVQAVFITVIFIILSISGLLVYLKQTRSIVETPRSFVKKLPPDVKKDLSKHTMLSESTAVHRIPILMYHYVEYVHDTKDKLRVSLNVNPNTFEAQLQTLLQDHYTFMTASELGEALNGTGQLPEKPILLTFDDGHWDFATDVLPLLKKYNVKATVYIITGFIGGSDFMSEDQVRDALASGLVEVGAHTVHHVYLKGNLHPVVQSEVVNSKRMLESTYHISVVSFAYPDGAFDTQAIDIVKSAGFTTAVSTIPGVEQSQQNRFFLYRLRPGYRTGPELLNYIQGSLFKEY